MLASHRASAKRSVRARGAPARQPRDVVALDEIDHLRRVRIASAPARRAQRLRLGLCRRRALQPASAQRSSPISEIVIRPRAVGRIIASKGGGRTSKYARHGAGRAPNDGTHLRFLQPRVQLCGSHRLADQRVRLGAARARASAPACVRMCVSACRVRAQIWCTLRLGNELCAHACRRGGRTWDSARGTRRRHRRNFHPPE